MYAFIFAIAGLFGLYTIRKLTIENETLKEEIDTIDQSIYFELDDKIIVFAEMIDGKWVDEDGQERTQMILRASNFKNGTVLKVVEED